VKTVQKGDRILYNGYAGEITFNNEDILIVKEEDILATV
jgi:co-chaperonin GroES (HSP10)